MFYRSHADELGLSFALCKRGDFARRFDRAVFDSYKLFCIFWERLCCLKRTRRMVFTFRSLVCC